MNPDDATSIGERAVTDPKIEAISPEPSLESVSTLAAPSPLPSQTNETSRREKITRALYAVGGAVGVALLALLVNVVTPFVIDWLRDGPPVAHRPGCENDAMPANVGEQNIGVWLSGVDENCWQTSLDGIHPGDSFDVLIEYRNNTGDQVDNATLQVQLPDGMNLVANSSKVGNANLPAGGDASDSILDGMNVGSYLDGANAWVTFRVRTADDFRLSCGLESHPIYARLPLAPTSQDDWVGSIVVTNRDC